MAKKNAVLQKQMSLTSYKGEEAAKASSSAIQSGTMKCPRALKPTSTRFAAPETKMTMTAAAISKPAQSLIFSKTGIYTGPAPRIAVRVFR
jgi:hypothetical protein